MADHRSKELAKIHVAKKQLALDDATYRAVLERLTGHASAKDLNARDRLKVLNEFHRLGFRAPDHRTPTPPSPSRDSALPLTGPGWGKDRLLSKIGALLAEAGRGWAYADGCARKMFKLESLRFCSPDQLQRIVAALTYDQQRRKRAKPTPPEAA